MRPGFFALFAVISLSACGPRADITPQIEVSPNVAGRYRLMPGHGEPVEDGPIGQDIDDGQTTHAFARELTAESIAGGASSAARPGDFVLGNDEVIFLLRGKAGEGFSVLDVTDPLHARSGIDGVAFATLASKDGTRTTFVVSKVSTFTTADGGAAITARGHLGKFSAETTLRLARSDRAVLVTTTISNEEAEKQGPFDAVDEIQWGVAKPFVPGHVAAANTVDASVGDFKGPYLGAVGITASYALTSTTGEVDATVHGKDAVVHLDRALSLAPHSQQSFDRVLVVGSRADTSSLVAELIRASGGALGKINVTITSASHRVPAIDSPALLVLRTPQGDDALTFAFSRETPGIIEVPPGAFTVRSASQDPNDGVRAQVRAGESVSANLVVP